MPESLVLAVVSLSDSFAAAWPDLAEELGIRQDLVEPSAVPVPGTVAIVLASGGEEERAIDLLPSVIGHAGDVPVYLVGALPSHRFAAEAVRRGAADYFVLPGDLDLLGRTLALRVQTTRQRARRSGESRPTAETFPSKKPSTLYGQSVWFNNWETSIFSIFICILYLCPTAKSRTWAVPEIFPSAHCALKESSEASWPVAVNRAVIALNAEN